MKNVLRETIESVLSDITIESGRKDEFERVVKSLEISIAEKIIKHEIDFYTESVKVGSYTLDDYKNSIVIK